MGRPRFRFVRVLTRCYSLPALPEEGPKISGGKPRYQIGDTVNVNCTSGSSNPPAQLDWFINGEKADSSFLRGPHTMFIGDDELQKTILGLEFRVGAKHFKDGDMKLKCLASISTIYWKTNEESVKGDKPLIKVLSSQDTSLPNKSRADRVQGKPLRFSAGGNECSRRRCRAIFFSGFLCVIRFRSLRRRGITRN
ncbi:UNVERIFIED_CONTAM: hypothetical protein PYX00_009351 [Menopon gallinae]|uniref:CD80-like immunoglobulin C2-set domain-containing protein n=1 Tax=Menopon gallinae TaxID=328185 RepID=A0AAW2HBA2_9NEOP